MSFIESEPLSLSSLEIDRAAFDLVNKFRKQNGKPPLTWDDSLFKIATGHSNNMASGKVPFGHQGFDKRAASIPFKHGLVSENVAMNSGNGDAAKVKLTLLMILSYSVIINNL